MKAVKLLQEHTLGVIPTALGKVRVLSLDMDAESPSMEYEVTLNEEGQRLDEHHQGSPFILWMPLSHDWGTDELEHEINEHVREALALNPAWPTTLESWLSDPERPLKPRSFSIEDVHDFDIPEMHDHHVEQTIETEEGIGFVEDSSRQKLIVRNKSN